MKFHLELLELVRRSPERLMGLTVDEGLLAYIPPLAPDEFARLEGLIRAENCREALMAWACAEKKILIDGHNRLFICLKHGLPFRVEMREFPDRQAAKDYVLALQAGRHNLSPEAAFYFRGKQYLAEKLKHGGTREKASGHDVHLKSAVRLGSNSRLRKRPSGAMASLPKRSSAIVACGEDCCRAILAHDGLNAMPCRRLAAMSPEERRS